MQNVRVKLFLNKRLKPVVLAGGNSYPLYIEVAVGKYKTQFRARINFGTIRKEANEIKEYYSIEEFKNNLSDENSHLSAYVNDQKRILYKMIELFGVKALDLDNDRLFTNFSTIYDFLMSPFSGLIDKENKMAFDGFLRGDPELKSLLHIIDLSGNPFKDEGFSFINTYRILCDMICEENAPYNKILYDFSPPFPEEVDNFYSEFKSEYLKSEGLYNIFYDLTIFQVLFEINDDEIVAFAEKNPQAYNFSYHTLNEFLASLQHQRETFREKVKYINIYFR